MIRVAAVAGHWIHLPSPQELRFLLRGLGSLPGGNIAGNIASNIAGDIAVLVCFSSLISRYIT
jgi:hypothetical protein